ncbi:aromatic amino acid lyase [Bradyrhizobium diversitatis]|uniref:aromatic amino acid lyase n=1 Tax=Bradyrhizobium diversitatis TaxID=2755406 RepID=UPI0035DAA657
MSALASGCSAVRPEIVRILAEYTNVGITAIALRYGSVAASGIRSYRERARSLWWTENGRQ